jgi:hypothetical protein
MDLANTVTEESNRTSQEDGRVAEGDRLYRTEAKHRNTDGYSQTTASYASIISQP